MSSAPEVLAGWRPLTEAVPLSNAQLNALTTRYAEPQRAYHGVAHITALARIYAEVAAGPGWIQPTEIKLAMLFHDAVYEPGAPDNEARSAALAASALDACDELDLGRVMALIGATRDHGAPAMCEAAARDPDLAHFLDADTAILGAAPQVYRQYAAEVRREFAAVPDVPYRAGRSHFLAAQLRRPRLFHSQWFEARHAGQARANIEGELLELRS